MIVGSLNELTNFKEKCANNKENSTHMINLIIFYVKVVFIGFIGLLHKSILLNEALREMKPWAEISVFYTYSQFLISSTMVKDKKNNSLPILNTFNSTLLILYKSLSLCLFPIINFMLDFNSLRDSKKISKVFYFEEFEIIFLTGEIFIHLISVQEVMISFVN